MTARSKSATLADIHLTQPRIGEQATIRALEAQLATYRHLMENMADVIIRGDAQRRRTYVSPSVRAVLGYEPSELLFGGALDLVHPSDKERVAAAISSVSDPQPKLRIEFKMRRKDGSYIAIEGRYAHVPEDGGIIAVLRDVTERKAAEDTLAVMNEKLAAANEMLLELANLDGLTGLANRRYLDERLDEECGRARRELTALGVLLLDIDFFKRFNDRYGHAAGDECLRRVSAAVVSVLRRPADCAARYGGEEIAVLMPGTDDSGTRHMAEHVRHAVESLQIEHADSPHCVVTVSIGCCAEIPSGARSSATRLLAAADAGLYAAKAAGRNQVGTGALAAVGQLA